jgi:hypothetical protein
VATRRHEQNQTTTPEIRTMSTERIIREANNAIDAALDRIQTQQTIIEALRRKNRELEDENRELRFRIRLGEYEH